jgi:hypothetical protein
MSAQTPTPGRIVYYQPGPSRLTVQQMPIEQKPHQPLVAQILSLESDTIVDLMVTDHAGRQFFQPGVELVQGELDPGSPPGTQDELGYCYWMPFQRQQHRNAVGGGSGGGSANATQRVADVPLRKIGAESNGEVLPVGDGEANGQ